MINAEMEAEVYGLGVSLLMTQWDSGLKGEYTGR
jgi:hypothetical protein